MGIVSKETVVLRRWEIDKQELGLSAEALASLQPFFVSVPFSLPANVCWTELGMPFPETDQSQRDFLISVAKFPRISDNQNMPEFSDACKLVCGKFAKRFSHVNF